MAVTFLSPGWAQALKDELNASEGFKAAAAGKAATIEQIITSPEGDTRYWIVIADGTIDMGVGEPPASADATITQSRDTAVALSNGSLSPVTGFMTGKIKVAGNMGLLMGLQAVLGQIPPAMQAIGTEF